MLEKLRHRSAEEEGFTLVELLVVMLILGILAAIAIPSFFNQRDKATDADAKSAARTAQTAMETYATGNQGSYAGVDATGTQLVTIEETLGDADLAVDYTEPGTDYMVTVDSDTGNTFSIQRNTDGSTELTCVGGGGCNGGEW